MQRRTVFSRQKYSRKVTPTACFMFAHKTNGEHGLPLHEQRARHSYAQGTIGTKQISGVVVLTVENCQHEWRARHSHAQGNISTKQISGVAVLTVSNSLHEWRARHSYAQGNISTKQISGVAVLTVSNCQHEWRARHSYAQGNISTKQISGVVVFTISDCLHERGAVTHCRLTILGLRYIVQSREEINGKRRKNCGVSR